MPFGPFGFNSGYREPAPRRLSWEELLGEEFAPSPRPSPITGLGGLSPEDRRQAQMDSLFAGLAQVGAGISSGRWDRLDPGAISAAQQATIQGANARQESEWAAENERRATDFTRGQKEREAKALFGMYERVAEGETPAFQAKAETAARTGSMAELAKLDAEKGPRARMRALGEDPDKFTVEELQERLAIELEKAKQRELLAGKVEETRQEAQARAEVEEASRISQRDKGVLWQPRETPAEAAARAGAVAREQAKYRDSGGQGGIKGQLYKQGEQIVFAQPPSAEHPKGIVRPLDGQPESVGNLVYFSMGNRRYVQDKRDPTGAAYESPIVREGDPGWERRPGQPGAAAPNPNKAPEAYGLRNAAVDGLLQGGSPTEALRLLEEQAKARGGTVNGYGAKQLFEEAKKLARRRGWKG